MTLRRQYNDEGEATGLLGALARYGDSIRFLVTVAVVAGLHFCDSRYVSTTAYALDRRDTEAVQKELAGTITGLQTAIALLQGQHEILNDHETRLRTLESRRLLGSLAPVVPAPISGSFLMN
jgi:hypothetical protein